MPLPKRVNPFYVVLVLAGVAFVITAASYGVMAFLATRQPGGVTSHRAHPLWQLMDEHGVAIMAVELSVLAVASFAAMGTDSFWSRQDDERRQEAKSLEDLKTEE